MEEQSLLSDLEFIPVLASTGKRFLNYLVDVIVYYILTFIYGVVLAVTGSNYIATDEDYKGLLYLSVIIILFLYYFLTELLFKGRTVGKFVTGTKVINENGTAPVAKTYLLRALCRFVPFEPFTAFGGNPWHDKWTKTYVIDVKKTALENPSYQ